jgi:carbon monoxide dehydrogenase subunit G
MRLRLAALLAVLALAQARPARAEWSPGEVARLGRGEVVVEIVEEPGPGGRLKAAIDIAAPPRLVWKVMLDCARAPAYVPGLQACRVLSAAADGSSDTREHRVRWIALLPSLTLQFRSDYIPEREIRVRRTGGDLAVMDGLWRLEPLQDGRGTRLHYDFRMAPRAPVPSGMIRAGLARDTPRVLEAVRREVERVGRS